MHLPLHHRVLGALESWLIVVVSLGQAALLLSLFGIPTSPLA